MKITETSLPGVMLIEPKVFGDDRGFFLETYAWARYEDAGIGLPFVQDNLSKSSRGVLRGLHLQYPVSQGKLVQVVDGAVFDVAVDVRRGSPHFGRWVGIELTGENHHQLYIPPGFAHGFAVISEFALFAYKCTDIYSPSTELGVIWNDPDIGIDWPLSKLGGEPSLSTKDTAYPRLAEIDPDRLPPYMEGAT